MYINQEKRMGHGKCMPYCPKDAIRIKQRKAAIGLDVCVECGACLKNAGCPRGAVYNIHLEASRAYQRTFSDPLGRHENTTLRHAGRGMEEAKTNDATGVVHSLDMITFAVELDRPGVGSTFHDLQTIPQAVAPYAEMFEVNNPVTLLITDRGEGLPDPSVLDESIISAIMELSCRLGHTASVLRALKEASQHIDTVLSLCTIYRVDERGDSLPVMNMMKEPSLDLHATSAKTNLGLGRPRYKDRIKEGGAALRHIHCTE